MFSYHTTQRYCKIALAAIATAMSLGPAALVLAQDAIPVTVAEVKQGAVDEMVELTGTVTAERRSSLSARTTGLVQVVHVDAGSRVEMGAVLLELDSALA